MEGEAEVAIFPKITDRDMLKNGNYYGSMGQNMPYYGPQQNQSGMPNHEVDYRSAKMPQTMYGAADPARGYPGMYNSQQPTHQQVDNYMSLPQGGVAMYNTPTQSATVPQQLIKSEDKGLFTTMYDNKIIVFIIVIIIIIIAVIAYIIYRQPEEEFPPDNSKQGDMRSLENDKARYKNGARHNERELYIEEQRRLAHAKAMAAATANNRSNTVQKQQTQKNEMSHEELKKTVSKEELKNLKQSLAKEPSQQRGDEHITKNSTTHLGSRESESPNADDTLNNPDFIKNQVYGQVHDEYTESPWNHELDEKLEEEMANQNIVAKEVLAEDWEKVNLSIEQRQDTEDNRCKATIRGGSQCKNKSVADGYCRVHASRR